MGITQHTTGSEESTAVSNLLLVTGNYMRPGCGAYPLRFGNLLSSIDADKLHAVISKSRKEAPSLLMIGKQAISKDARRSMAVAVGLLNVLVMR
jgi:hypothetical protein